MSSGGSNLKLQLPKGTRDFLPGQMKIRNSAKDKIIKIFKQYGYREVQTPTFEHKVLFSEHAGRDIEEKMFTFNEDKHDDKNKGKHEDKYTLRPDMTSPLSRILAMRKQEEKPPYKYYYFGRCFRKEIRPRPGRYREFWHAGIEFSGSNLHMADAEVIAVAVRTLKTLGIKDFRLKIGDIQIFKKILEDSSNEKIKKDNKTQNELIRKIDKLIGIYERCKLFEERDIGKSKEESINSYVREKIDILIEMQKRLIECNPEYKDKNWCIVDRKNELKGKPITFCCELLPLFLENTIIAEWIQEYNLEENIIRQIIEISKIRGNSKDTLHKLKNILGDKEAEDLFKNIGKVTQGLASFGVQEDEYEIVLGLVRGLNYYSGIVFEIDCEKLGAEKEICGGGRYDQLVNELGGKPVPSVGFALGFDRIIQYLTDIDVASKTFHKIETNVMVIPAPTFEKNWPIACEVAEKLREMGINVEVEIKRRPGRAIAYANKMGYRYCIIIGDDEAPDHVNFRDMQRKKELKMIKISDLLQFFTFIDSLGIKTTEQKSEGKNFILTGGKLTLEDIVDVARNFTKVELSPDLKNKIKKTREEIDKIVREERIVYGVNTGVGDLCSEQISKDETKQLQENIIFSHSVAVGSYLPVDVVRAMMLLTINSLSKGYSGVRVEIIETLIEMLNEQVHPWIPEKGSLGASGDLAQLAHMTLVILGKGEVIEEAKEKESVIERKIPGKVALIKAGIKPIELSAKEGLALTNGTHAMTAISALLIYDTEHLVKTAEIAAAMSIEALKASLEPLDKSIHHVRGHPGQMECAKNILSLIRGSKIVSKSISVNSKRKNISYLINFGTVRAALYLIHDTIEKLDRLKGMKETKNCGKHLKEEINIVLPLLKLAKKDIEKLSKISLTRKSEKLVISARSKIAEANYEISKLCNILIKTTSPEIILSKLETATINLSKLTSIMENIISPPIIQDAYSLRCIPQVIGASKDAIKYGQTVVEKEINAITDNPLIFSESHRYLSGGNFHGQPIAIALDVLGIALAEIGSISERRIARLIDKKYSNGLPSFLVFKSGLNNGFMLAHYTAASIALENRNLAAPASVNSIPTSAGQEDHISMGTLAARKAREILNNVCYIIAIELLCAAQGIDFRNPLNPVFFEKGKFVTATDPRNVRAPGRGTGAAYNRIRAEIRWLDSDRIMYPDMKSIYELVKNGEVLAAVENSRRRD